MTSLACLAEFPGAIQHVFLTDEYNPRGRYVLQLYSPKPKVWETIVVDDWVPCERGSGKPIFAQPKGKELWVTLLEKAFAKVDQHLEACLCTCIFAAAEFCLYLFVFA
eukprot:SAG31_NODE_26621_length_439_cov_0.914706_1_plen_108_part_00